MTYEVDDPQENYDDIDASPEIAQTKAEVHGSPQLMPESRAAAPQESVQGDDYLVPGQDGWAASGFVTLQNKIQSANVDHPETQFPSQNKAWLLI